MRWVLWEKNMLRNLKQLSWNFFGSAEHSRHASQILHLTDFEGTRFFFDAINKSKVVSYHPETGLHFTNNNLKQHFIFGGDATDRGSHDLAITEMLIDFKKRHPNDVTLLAGNREIKNGRFSIELAEPFIRERLLHSQQPRWLQQQTVPRDYVIARMKIENVYTNENPEAIKKYVDSLSIAQCQLIYLQWMLEKTMGCPNTFRYRREEISKKMLRMATEEDVLQSFLIETAPTGLMGQFLQHAQVGIIIPEARLLAVHGGLSTFNIGRIPDMSMTEQRIHHAQQWIKQFNDWYVEQIQYWIRFKPQQLTQPGCTALDDSVLPTPKKPKYIMTADMLNPDRNFKDIPSDVSQYLRQNNISIVLTGHQPCGDHPVLLRNADNNILFVNGDTSYANATPQSLGDTRGDVYHTVEISVDRLSTDVVIEAKLSDGTTVTTKLCITPNQIQGDPYIGTVISDGRLVQCKLPSDDYRLVQQQGFKVSYSTLTAIELAKILENKTELRI
jgi:hypothetical protein